MPPLTHTTWHNPTVGGHLPFFVVLNAFFIYTRHNGQSLTQDVLHAATAVIGGGLNLWQTNVYMQGSTVYFMFVSDYHSGNFSTESVVTDVSESNGTTQVLPTALSESTLLDNATTVPQTGNRLEDVTLGFAVWSVRTYIVIVRVRGSGS